MALIKCPECASEVSDRAGTCVKCGCPLTKCPECGYVASGKLAYCEKCGCPMEKPTGSSGTIEPNHDTVEPSYYEVELNHDENHLFWNKHRVVIAIVAVVLLVAAITNPSQREHQQAATSLISRLSSNFGGGDNEGLFAGEMNKIAAVGAALFIERQNLLFFSLTRVRITDDVIGFGAFGHVWLLNEDTILSGLGDGQFSDEASNDAKAAPPQKVIGSFTDSRDGKKYRTVKIGNQTWMAENLNYKMMDYSPCYNDEEVNCQKYGRLYEWDDAIKACPAGWHLPTDKEWDDLTLAVGGKRQIEKYKDYWHIAGKNLKSKVGWEENGNGVDEYGFSALPGGSFMSGRQGGFHGIGSGGSWWSATEDDGGIVWHRQMNEEEYVYRWYGIKTDDYNTDYYSVRCVKN